MLLLCFQVSDVKAKIETEKGSDTFPSGKQKLIYNGKVLENADPLSKYEINEKIIRLRYEQGNFFNNEKFKNETFFKNESFENETYFKNEKFKNKTGFKN